MNSPLLGADIGKKRTGLSLSEGGMLATPLKTISHPTQPKEIAQLLFANIKQHNIATIIIGIPYHEDNTLSEQAKWVKLVIADLSKLLSTHLPEVEIKEHNEFASTIDGKQLYPKLDDNQAAAAVILQDYIDTNTP